jgi:hypothetical protein
MTQWRGTFLSIGGWRALIVCCLLGGLIWWVILWSIFGA